MQPSCKQASSNSNGGAGRERQSRGGNEQGEKRPQEKIKSIYKECEKRERHLESKGKREREARGAETALTRLNSLWSIKGLGINSKTIPVSY